VTQVVGKRGLEAVLKERNLWPSEGLNVEAARDLLAKQPDVMRQNTRAQVALQDECTKDGVGGRRALMYTPRYNCELQPMERVWAMVKIYCKRWSQWAIGVMMELIDEAMRRVTSYNLRLFIGLARKYEEMYSNNNEPPAADVPKRIRDIGINEALKSGAVPGVSRAQIEAIRASLASSLRETPECVKNHKKYLAAKQKRLDERGGGRRQNRPAVPGAMMVKRVLHKLFACEARRCLGTL
jgi:hypothetical protein